MTIKYIIKTPNDGENRYWRAINPADTAHFNSIEAAQDTLNRLESVDPHKTIGAEIIGYDIECCKWGQAGYSCGVELEPIAGLYLVKSIDRLRCPGCGRLVKIVVGGADDAERSER